MINRTIVLNSVEPALLSMRSPMGVDLDLGLLFIGQNSAPVNPDTLQPQLALLPRSGGGMYAYDVITSAGEQGFGNVSVPGTAMMDARGYTIELYSRREASNPDNPPVPNGLIAKGTLAIEGSAYTQYGPLSMINVPTIVGATGPQGPQGIQGSQGPTGQRGSVWTAGDGPPVIVGTEVVGDMYLQDNGDVYRFDGMAWTLGRF